MKSLGATALAVLAVLVVSVVLIGGSSASFATRTVNVGCSQNLANAVNSDSKTTATRFVLGSCTYTASATLKPQNGDEIVGVPGEVRERDIAGTYPDAITSTIKASASLEVIAKPEGRFHSEWVRWTGANFSGKAGTGVAIAGGAMSTDSNIYASLFDHNQGAGLSGFRANLIHVESAFNGSPASLGFIASGVKCTNVCSVHEGFFHDNYGAGVWCDSGCEKISAGHDMGFWVSGAETSRNTGAGIRYENSASEALIEFNHIWGNSHGENRGGISVRDAQNAVVRFNTFAGAGYAHNQPPKNIAVVASASGKAGRVRLANIAIHSNTLNGESVKGCGLSAVNCARED